MDKFQDKYRIASTRLQNWDYGWNSAYFITICTANRECYFGEIINQQMIFSKFGKIVEIEWLKIPNIRPDMNLTLNAFQIMPNHFHGIIIIGDNEFNSKHDNHCENHGRDAMHRVSAVSTNDQKNRTQNRFGPQRKNLASIIRGFKSAITANARKINPNFGWQPRYHDHIIRDDVSFQRIRNYIISNPKNWKDDTFHS